MKKILVFGIAAGAIILILTYSPAKYAVERGLDGVFTVFSDKKRLVEENALLSAKCDSLEKSLSERTVLFDENKKLKELLGIKKFGKKRVTARIFNGGAKNVGLPFTVDRGRVDGVKEGLCAVSGGGLAGIVTSCGENWAEITPVMSKNFNISVTDCSNGRVYLLKGDRLMYVSAEDNAAVGDILATSGMNDDIPGGIKIGKIKGIRKKNGGNVIAAAEPYVDVKELDYVVIPL